MKPLRRRALKSCDLARRTVLLPAVALLALPSTAASLGLPATYPHSIAITGSGQGVRVARFEVATRSVGPKVPVTVRVAATSIAGTRALVVAVGPCTAGPITSPLCEPRASVRLRLSRTPIDTTRSFLVARPARFPNALRVTVTSADQPVPFQRERVGGGCGTAEILLNSGTWRFRQGTRWGLVATPPTGLVLDASGSTAADTSGARHRRTAALYPRRSARSWRGHAGTSPTSCDQASRSPSTAR